MMSILFVFILLGIFVLLLGFAQAGGYPERLEIGPLAIEFSPLDKACYLVAMLSVLVGVVVGIAMIWTDASDALGKVAGTAGLLFAGSLFVLVLNRLMRGRRA